jgi:hypothetical protein
LCWWTWEAVGRAWRQRGSTAWDKRGRGLSEEALGYDGLNEAVGCDWLLEIGGIGSFQPPDLFLRWTVVLLPLLQRHLLDFFCHACSCMQVVHAQVHRERPFLAWPADICMTEYARGSDDSAWPRRGHHWSAAALDGLSSISFRRFCAGRQTGQMS